MFEAWRETTRVFILQALFTAATYGIVVLNGERNHPLLIAVVIASLVLAMFSLFAERHRAAVLTATGATLVVCDVLINGAGQAVTALVTARLMWVAMKMPEDEPFFLRLVAATPLGVGTALGGAVLLKRYLAREHWFLGRVTARQYAGAFVVLAFAIAAAFVLGVAGILSFKALLFMCLGCVAAFAVVMVHVFKTTAATHAGERVA